MADDDDDDNERSDRSVAVAIVCRQDDMTGRRRAPNERKYVWNTTTAVAHANDTLMVYHVWWVAFGYVCIFNYVDREDRQMLCDSY